MDELKNVIEHLLTIRTWAELDGNMGRGMEPKCCLRIAEWVDDALKMLKAQQPRVMTLEEAQTALHNDIIVWVEIKSEIYSGLFCGFRIDESDHFIMQNDDVLYVTDLDGGDGVELYGKSIRCWTAKPDEKVRAETPWQE